ncbi:hypothetical protein BJ508DRAFT_310551 [Ascobolus immersus RN42]|uniref:Uncharacterized protein n=1 Tax=Ascobolus immersus RN42 TaxID=1160509 RepID=A0A3N4I5B8_ASCIM|nr:hypothetical protein BJ508DRAFT_310551 [Ascobolus immersus RN42]
MVTTKRVSSQERPVLAEDVGTVYVSYYHPEQSTGMNREMLQPRIRRRHENAYSFSGLRPILREKCEAEFVRTQCSLHEKFPRDNIASTSTSSSITPRERRRTKKLALDDNTHSMLLKTLEQKFASSTQIHSRTQATHTMARAYRNQSGYTRITFKLPSREMAQRLDNSGWPQHTGIRIT